MQYESIYLTNHIRPGRFRYEGMGVGCGCCGGPTTISLEECRSFVEELEQVLSDARAALADMEANGEKHPDEG